jgi:glucose/arabinose dehydrogenase
VHFLRILTSLIIPLRFTLLWLAAAGALATLSAQAQIPKTVTVRNYFGAGFKLERPVAVIPVPAKDSAFAVVQQSGAVVIVQYVNGAWVKSVFDSVAVGGINSGTAGQDGGLLGFAFHPYFQLNRKYYLWYVASYSVRASPGRILFEERRADSTLRQRNTAVVPRTLLSLNKPYIYHNGGTLKFGTDGYLYTAVGDGGGDGDPQNRSQSKDSIWGKFLRIHVDGGDAFPGDPNRNYAIPPDNPFVDSSNYLPEIWAYGLRSPWKWDWNPMTGQIWLGDIGQARYEEITTVPRGGNLGWKIREGGFCFTGSTCSSAGLTPPAFTFPNRTFGYAVTGGTFFTGDTTAAFHGVYVYGDFGSDKLYAVRPGTNGAAWTDTATLGTVVNLVSLDKDQHGRILAVSMSTTKSIGANLGEVFVLESPDMRPVPTSIHQQIEASSGRTPFRYASITVAHFLENRDRYEAFDLNGNKVRVTDAPSGILWVREKGPLGAQRPFLRVLNLR